jgi:hypothetical protein
MDGCVADEEKQERRASQTIGDSSWGWKRAKLPGKQAGIEA